MGTDGLLLGAWAAVEGVRSVLDIGTGTGLVALMLAQRTAHAAEPVQVDAIDTSAAARRCATYNFAHSPWAERLRVVGEDLALFYHQAPQRYDLIVSNPPFYTEQTTSPHHSRQQSRQARFLPMPLLAQAAAHLLTPRGRLCAVLTPTTGQQLAQQSAIRGLYLTRLAEVRTHPQRPAERWLVQLERSPYLFERQQIDLYTETGDYSPHYRTMTGQFLLWKRRND